MMRCVAPYPVISQVSVVTSCEITGLGEVCSFGMEISVKCGGFSCVVKSKWDLQVGASTFLELKRPASRPVYATLYYLGNVI